MMGFRLGQSGSQRRMANKVDAAKLHDRDIIIKEPARPMNTAGKFLKDCFVANATYFWL